MRGGNRIKSGYRWINSNGYVLVKLLSILEAKIARLEKRVTLLEAENAALQTQLRQEMPA
jgi:hypothetical protein